MPSLSKALIEHIANDNTETRLVIEGTLDYQGIEPDLFWNQLYDAFKNNQTLRELWFVELDVEVMRKLVIILDEPTNQISGVSLEKLSANVISMLIPNLQRPSTKVNGIGLRSLNFDAITVILPVLCNPNSTIQFIGLKELDSASILLLATNALQNNNLKAFGLVDLAEESLSMLFDSLQHQKLNRGKRPKILCSQFIPQAWQEKFNLLNSSLTTVG